MKRRLLVVLMATVFAVSSLCACGEKDEGRSDRGSRNERERDVEEEEEEEDEDSEDKESPDREEKHQIADLDGDVETKPVNDDSGSDDSYVELDYDYLFGSAFPENFDAVDYTLRMDVVMSDNSGSSISLEAQRESVRTQDLEYTYETQDMSSDGESYNETKYEYFDIPASLHYVREIQWGQDTGWTVTSESYSGNTDTLSFATAQDTLFNKKCDISLIDAGPEGSYYVVKSTAGNILSGEFIDMLSDATSIMGTASMDDVPTVVYLVRGSMNLDRIEVEYPTGPVTISGEQINIDRFDFTLSFKFNNDVDVPTIPAEAQNASWDSYGQQPGEFDPSIVMNDDLDSSELSSLIYTVNGKSLVVPASESDLNAIGFTAEKNPGTSTVITFEKESSNLFITATKYSSDPKYTGVAFSVFNYDKLLDVTVSYAGVTMGETSIDDVIAAFGKPDYDYTSSSSDYRSVEYYVNNNKNTITFQSGVGAKGIVTYINVR